MYNLTGARQSSGRDPWAHPTPNPGTNDTAPSADKSSPTQGPPKPIKSSAPRSLPTPPQRPTAPKPLPEPSPKPLLLQKTPTQEKPKILPKPPRIGSQGLPASANLNLGESTPRKLPPVPQKPDYINSSQKTNEPRKVSLKLTNYDIPQFTSDQSQRDQLDQSKRVSIPVFKFPEHDETEDQSIPSFSITRDDQEVSPVGESNDDRPSGRGRRPPIPHYQAEMIKRGLNCADCYVTLGTGRAITANGLRYHPSHFTCYECSIPLEHVEFYTHFPPSLPSLTEPEREEIYCHFDYHELFTPRCHVCTTPVIRNGIKALDKIYHSEHFFCALCSQTFVSDPDSGVDFVQHDNLAWHPACYAEKFNEKYYCRKCGGRILEDNIIKMGINSFFHDACFVCAGKEGGCRRSLKDGFYWSNQNEGICKPCKEFEVKTTVLSTSR